MECPHVLATSIMWFLSVPDQQAAGRQHMLYKKRAYDDKPADGGAPTAKQGRAGTQTRTYSVNQVGYQGEKGGV